MEKLIVVSVFIVCYALALSRKVKIAYASLGAAAALMLMGVLSPYDALFKAVKWDVLGIYWGFLMVSYAFMKSRMPELIANRLLANVKVERYAIFLLCVLTAFLSTFMENVGVVLMMAPVAIAVSKRLDSDLFQYMISIAVCSNVVTTVSMVADPPSIILAMETGMKPLDFYYFLGRPGLGTISICGVLTALAVLFWQFRHLKKTVLVEREAIPVTKGASVLFVLGVAGLAIGPEFGIRPGYVGMAVGLLSLALEYRNIKEMTVEFDWNSLFFICGVFMVIHALSESGILKDFADLVVRAGLDNPTLMLAFLVWISVALSAIMDNVPYTILMIPVCQNMAASFGIEAWPFLYGMLIGTGIGGNITPVGATANVFACGVLERMAYKVPIGRYLKISLPFSVAAVAAGHLLIQLLWL